MEDRWWWWSSWYSLISVENFIPKCEAFGVITVGVGVVEVMVFGVKLDVEESGEPNGLGETGGGSHDFAHMATDF